MTVWFVSKLKLQRKWRHRETSFRNMSSHMQPRGSRQHFRRKETASTAERHRWKLYADVNIFIDLITSSLSRIPRASSKLWTQCILFRTRKPLRDIRKKRSSRGKHSTLSNMLVKTIMNEALNKNQDNLDQIMLSRKKAHERQSLFRSGRLRRFRGFQDCLVQPENDKCDLFSGTFSDDPVTDCRQKRRSDGNIESQIMIYSLLARKEAHDSAYTFLQLSSS